MSDLTKAGLKGPVKVCSTERRSSLWSERQLAAPRTDLLELSRESFDIKGNILEQWQRNAVGTEWGMAAEYDQEGKLLERRYSGIRHGSDQAFGLFFYAYDSLGRIEHVTAQSLKGDSRVYESYQYGPNGESETIFYPDPALCRSLGSDVSDFHSSPDAIAIATRLNQSGQPLKEFSTAVTMELLDEFYSATIARATLSKKVKRNPPMLFEQTSGGYIFMTRRSDLPR